MDDIKMTALLTELLEQSKTVGAKAVSTYTAERFMVALLVKLTDVFGVVNDEELIVARAYLAIRIPDFSLAKASLLAHVNGASGFSVTDNLYIKKKLKSAFEMAKECGREEASTVNLLSNIIGDPTPAIEAVMVRAPFPDEENEDEEVTLTDDELIASIRKKYEQCQAEADVGKTTDTTAEPEETPAAETLPEDAKGEIATLISDVKRIRAELKQSIFGQDNAIDVFVTGYFRASMLSMMDKTRKRPRATFLFAGPPGVGKTYLAESAAKTLGLPFERFDMSEYCTQEAAVEFCGSDGVYKNSKSGNFTSYVSKNPKCVILFDEIEKAHISIIHLFLQILDAGRIRDSKSDKEISLKDAILIFTTNAGKQLYLNSEDKDLSSVSRKVIIRALEKDVNPQTGQPYFPGAICSRFASGNVVMFNHIGAHDLRHIAKKEIKRQTENLKDTTGIETKLDEFVYTALLFAEGTNADARTIRSRAETFFNDEIYELMRLIESERVKTNISDVEKIKFSVDLTNSDEDVKKLFVPEDKPRVLILSSAEKADVCRTKAPKIEFIGASTCGDAINTIKENDIDIILLDIQYDVTLGEEGSLNIEDAQSPARDFLRFLREHKNSTPVYLLGDGESVLTEEERASFTKQGIRDVLVLTKGKDIFAARISDIAEMHHQQASMIKLAKENKLIAFESSQTVSRNGKNAEIKLFDFHTVVAVDSEDAKNVLSSVSTPNVRFDDVIGADEAKKELKYFVEYLRDPKKYMGTGVKAPKGVILYGPPGTGKTMLAKAMAAESGVTFIAAEGNQFLKRYVGQGSETVHELFTTARKYAPSILFIDEIDAIARERRGGENAAVSGENTLTAFLAEMDGFGSDPTRPVFVLAATNFDVTPGGAKSLDPALMRRFDRRVYIDLPDRAARTRFLKLKISKNKALDISDNQVDNIAMRSTGMSLAELDSVVELALRSAIREGSTKVTDAILEEAFETFNGGEAKKWDSSQLERVARHEAGHAILCYLSGETPSYVTVVARGNSGGYMKHAEQEGKAVYTKRELLARIRTSLGGRAAEIVYYGPVDGISTGASGDLSNATSLARHMICSYGMDDDFGLSVIGDTSALTGELSSEVRDMVNRILKDQMTEAVRLISENRDMVDSLVEALIAKGHLDSDEIKEAMPPKK